MRWGKTAAPGDKLRCRYCQWILTLSPEQVLSDGTQTYHWVDRDGNRACQGRTDVRGKQRRSGPWHRPAVIRPGDPASGVKDPDD